MRGKSTFKKIAEEIGMPTQFACYEIPEDIERLAVLAYFAGANDLCHLTNRMAATEKYILLHWPESQDFIGNRECFMCAEINGAVFVPENLLNKY